MGGGIGSPDPVIGTTADRLVFALHNAGHANADIAMMFNEASASPEITESTIQDVLERFE